MMETSARFEFRWKWWAPTACIALILFAVCAQAVHVHTQSEPSGATCLACVSAHSGAPVSPVVSSAPLAASASVLVLPEPETSSYEAILPPFIRPPPSR
jgi:hypothetical protein